MTSKVLRLRRVMLVPGTLMAAVLLAGCGGHDSSAATATPVPATATVTATSEPGGSRRVAEVGDSVSVHYQGTRDDGSVFDSSRERGPLSFVVGSGQMISGFDAAVHGMALGETVTVRLEPAEAYGERDESLVLEFPASDAPKGLSAGDQVSVSGRTAVVLEVTDEIVRIDANHELAGQALTFEIELVSIE